MKPKIYLQKLADKQVQASDNTGKSPSVTFLTLSLRPELFVFHSNKMKTLTNVLM